MTNDDEGGEGVSIPPKNDDVIYEQPLTGMTPKQYWGVIGGTFKKTPFSVVLLLLIRWLIQTPIFPNTGCFFHWASPKIF